MLTKEIQALHQDLEALNRSHEELSEASIRKITTTIAEAYLSIRKCKAQ